MARMHAVAVCCVLALVAVTFKGAYAKTVLYNKSGRDLVLILPQAHAVNIDLAPGKSVELEGVQQQRGVMIKDVGSGAVAGPLDLPNHHALEARWFHASTSTAGATSNPLSAAKLASASASVGGLLYVGLQIP